MTTGISDWGAAVATVDVDDAIVPIIKLWLPTYLKRRGQEKGLAYTLPTPAFYGNSIDKDEFLDHQLPAIYVTTAKTKSTSGGANFIYQATWDVTISCVLRGTNPAATRELCSNYEVALRRCVIQKCRKNSTPFTDTNITSPLSSTHWLGSEVAPLPLSSRKGRYLAAGIGKYNVATDFAAQSFGGPDRPDADNYVPLATVTNVVIDVESEE